MITQPMNYEEAIRFILDKNPNPAEWDSGDWSFQKAAVRVRSFFSSKVESARFLDRAQAFIFDYLAGTTEKVVAPDGTESIALRAGGRADFVRAMRGFMIAEGMATEAEMRAADQSDLEDIRSESRLRLIFDTNVRQAYGYGNWRQGMSPAVRYRFPAARFVRKRGVALERPRHAKHEGDVRLKTDYAYWSNYQNDPAIGGFGVPWEPYGFNSGMGQQDVTREDARAQGIDVDRKPTKQEKQPDLNEGLSASTKKMDPDLKARLLEELRGMKKNRDAGAEGRAAALRIREERDRIILD